MSLILLDVDGPCADFTGALLAEVAPRFSPADVTMWDFIEELLSPKERSAAEACLSHTFFWSHLPVTPGAQKAVEMLRSSHNDVVFVTSPWESCTGWETARRTWLATNFDTRSKDVIICSRKELVRGNVLIDDKPSNVDNWSSRNRETGILYKAPHNTGTFSWDSPESQSIIADLAACP